MIEDGGASGVLGSAFKLVEEEIMNVYPYEMPSSFDRVHSTVILIEEPAVRIVRIT